LKTVVSLKTSCTFADETEQKRENENDEYILVVAAVTTQKVVVG
jgi:hypothetical protein